MLRIYIQIHTCTHTYIRMDGMGVLVRTQHVYMHTYIHTCILYFIISLHVYIHTHIIIYIYTYTDTDTDTHTHTHRHKLIHIIWSSGSSKMPLKEVSLAMRGRPSEASLRARPPCLPCAHERL
jgi:hypothetical protein